MLALSRIMIPYVGFITFNEMICVLICFQAGKVDSLTALVEEFLNANAEARKQVLQKLENESESLQGNAARLVSPHVYFQFQWVFMNRCAFAIIGSS